MRLQEDPRESGVTMAGAGVVSGKLASCPHIPYYLHLFPKGIFSSDLKSRISRPSSHPHLTSGETK